MDRPGTDASGARVVRAAVTLAAAVGAAVVLLALVHDATRDRVTASERAHRAAAFDRVLGNASYDNDLLADRIDVREMAAVIGSIPWEILWRIGSRIERIYSA